MMTVHFYPLFPSSATFHIKHRGGRKLARGSVDDALPSIFLHSTTGVTLMHWLVSMVLSIIKVPCKVNTLRKIRAKTGFTSVRWMWRRSHKPADKPLSRSITHTHTQLSSLLKKIRCVAKLLRLGTSASRSRVFMSRGYVGVKSRLR